MKHWVVVLVMVVMPMVSYGFDVQLEWDYVENPIAPAISFSMYRDVNCAGEWLFLASIPRSELMYVDRTVESGRVYCYQVTAIGTDAKESSASNTVGFQVPLPPPNAPSNLRWKIVQ